MNKLKIAVASVGTTILGLVSTVGIAFATTTPTTVEILISNARAGVASSTGMSISDLVTWGIDNLFKMFLGSGLALLYDFRWYIVLLIIISGVIGFAFRGNHTKKS
jgi:hypothetical protein